MNSPFQYRIQGVALRAKRHASFLVLLLVWCLGVGLVQVAPHAGHAAQGLVGEKVATPLPSGEKETIKIAIDPSSRLFIHGTTNVNRFTCAYQPALETLYLLWLPQADKSVQMEGAVLAVPTDCFDCGNRKMNRDFFDALQGDAHPRVRIRLRSAHWQTDTEGEFTVRAESAITIAGVTKTISLNGRVERLTDGNLLIHARQALHMSDFGIEPPTAMLGMVRTHDAITIELDLRIQAWAPNTP